LAAASLSGLPILGWRVALWIAGGLPVRNLGRSSDAAIEACDLLCHDPTWSRSSNEIERTEMVEEGLFVVLDFLCVTAHQLPVGVPQ
jgi:hypothetical protein